MRQDLKSAQVGKVCTIDEPKLQTTQLVTSLSLLCSAPLCSHGNFTYEPPIFRRVSITQITHNM